MSEVTLEIKPNEEGELIIRQGQAAPIYDPEVIQSDGLALKSLVDYANHRIENNKLKPANTLVSVNQEDRTIELCDNVNDKFGNKLSGKLQISKYLKRFKINSGDSFDQDDLVKLIRFNKRFVKGEYGNILKSIENFKVKITQKFESKAQNRTGSRALNF
jgi:hypothetical protein